MNNNNYLQVYEDIFTSLTKKKSVDITNVTKAFKFAEKKHAGQFRKSGEPYILHPLCVASILENLDFNTDVISAAILHDVVEDCNVSVKEISENFNTQIAEIVDAVTAINKETFMPDIEDIYSNTTDFLKLAIDDKTFQKLIAMGKENKFAFYIKFADRMHNLDTISSFARYKQLAKVEQTEKWLIPLTELLKSKYFNEQLKNYCFKIRYKDENPDFFENYNKSIKSTFSQAKQSSHYLSENINYLIRTEKTKFSLQNVKLEPKTELEIFEEISAHYDISQLSQILESNFSKIPLYNMYFIFSRKPNKKNIQNLLFDLADYSKIKGDFSLIGLHYDQFKNSFIKIKNKSRLIFDLLACSRQEYTLLTNGTIEGTDIDIIDDTASGEIATDFISVKTRSGELIKIQNGSTALDFAFKIHKDIGLSCKYAIINNMPTKSPIYTKLRQGDKIEIICEKDDNDLLKSIAELRWLVYVTNESSQRILIKYFEKKYNVTNNIGKK